MKRFHFQLVPGIFFIVALTVLLSLGTWQLKRLAWKNDLVETITSRLSKPRQLLLPSAEWGSVDLAAINYQVVEAEGRFNQGDEVHLYAQVAQNKAKYSGTGYWIVAPFYLESGAVILVNKGFVPEKYKDPKARPWKPFAGIQKIIGIIKTDQGVNYFTPENDLPKNIWFTRNVAAISSHLKLKQAAPFMIALTKSLNSDALPQPREAKISIANNHKGYAITWFGLALTLIAVFFAFSLRSTQEND